jgi:prepilin peptidase CpaA
MLGADLKALAMLQTLQFALVLIFPVLVVTGGLRDLISFTIPNWVSLALAAAFFPAALAVGAAPSAIGVHAAVGAAGLVVGMGMFAAGWIGGGDAKLFAASALWLGWPAAAPFALYMGLAGGALALALLVLRSAWVNPFVMTGPAWFARLARPGEGTPYGVAIAIGAMCAFPVSTLPAALGS